MKVDRQSIGKLGEDIVCEYVLSRGMNLLERNYRAQKGEIDLIVQEGETIAFVEVKTRTGAMFGTPAEAVGFRKQKIMIETAQHFIAKKNCHDMCMRFDVAEVYLKGTESRVHYIKNAFIL